MEMVAKPIDTLARLHGDEVGLEARNLPKSSISADRLDAVVYDKIDAIAVVTLNRPECLNAYDIAMRDALYDALLAIRDDPEVRVVVLAGRGSSFCTGGDLREFGTATSPIAARTARWRRDVWGLLLALPQPTIAAVHGYTVGGGFEMALLCDLCIAARNTRLCFPETRLGMIPGVGGTQTAARRFGHAVASDLLLSGRWIDAAAALRLGLAQRVVPSRQLRREALAWAADVARLPADLVTRLKRAVHGGLDLPLPQALEWEKRLAS